MLKLNEEDLDKQFDKLVFQGHLIYGPSTITSLVDDGVQIEFRVTPALLAKPLPQAKGSEPNKPEHKLGPGSDLGDDPAAIITTINDSHLLLFNKFCIYRSQLMIVTADSYRRQHDPLDEDDLDAARVLLLSMKSPHYVFFNGGIVAGCSRKHKHMQVMPMPKDETHLLVSLESTHDFPKMPYRYFCCDFTDHGLGMPKKEVLSTIYLQFLGECKELLNETTDACVPHNVILTKHWMMVIPRTKRNFEGSSSVNAPGMLGMIWLMRDDELTKWQELGPAMVLGQLGVADDRHKNPKVI